MSQSVDSTIQATKAVGDVVSFGVVVGALAQWLPAVAALFTIVWTVIRICETRTVQAAFARWRACRK